MVLQPVLVNICYANSIIAVRELKDRIRRDVEAANRRSFGRSDAAVHLFDATADEFDNMNRAIEFLCSRAAIWRLWIVSKCPRIASLILRALGV